jgi:hypothetical protein
MTVIVPVPGTPLIVTDPMSGTAAATSPAGSLNVPGPALADPLAARRATTMQAPAHPSVFRMEQGFTTALTPR